jgi:hypothetical protein
MKACLIVILLGLSSCIGKKPYSDQFNFSFSFDETESFSSFDSTYRRTMLGGYGFYDTVLKISLNKTEEQIIFKVMEQNEIMTLPATFEEDRTQPCIIPAFFDILIVQINGVKKRIDYSYYCQPKNIQLAEKYLRIAKTIRTVLSNKREIQHLPKSNMIFM